MMCAPPNTRLRSVLLAVALLFGTAAWAQQYTKTVLVSNTGIGFNDPNLQNSWGLVSSPGSPWWISNNNSGTSSLYSIDPVTGAAIPALVNPPNNFVTIRSAPSQTPPGGPVPAGTPTGIMFNGTPTDFLLVPNTPKTNALFLWVTEDGTVQGWNPGVNPGSAVIKVDHSTVPNAAEGAVYKGATIAEIEGQHFILAANFRSGQIDVFNSSFVQVTLDNKNEGFHAFRDEQIPHGFAPFNVQGVGPNIYVTYAKQDEFRHDPVGGAGLGFVDVFSPRGHLLQRLQSGPWMNAPWGVVWAPQHFGEFTNTILIGNFRGGNISAFNGVTGRWIADMLDSQTGTPLLIDGLWALRFGNDGKAGPATTLFFTAGPDHEQNGLFGTLLPVAKEKGEDDEQ